MQGMKVIELLEILAHDRSDPVVYFAAKTLPAAGAATDVDAGTAGDGLAIPIPSWARHAMVFITYAIGVGGNANAGAATADLWIGAAVEASLVPLIPNVSNGAIDIKGSSLLAANIGGAGTIGILISETGDTAHPGIVDVSVVFSR